MDESKSTVLVVTRHGETAWNLERRAQGHLDSDLTELGLRQAQALAERLAGERFDALYSSDLGRAMNTARAIADRIDLEPTPDVRLRERNLGIMQGLTSAEFRERFPEEYARFRSGDPDYGVPEGESARQRSQRAVEACEDLARRHGGGRILLVSHGGFLDSLFRRATGYPIEEPRRFSIFNAGLNVFQVSGDAWRLDTWGSVDHLRRMGTMDDY